MVRFLRKAILMKIIQGLIMRLLPILATCWFTCYSLYSRNRTFGNMIGKGYSVKTAQLELSMVAEGYNANRRSIHHTNQRLQAQLPIADAIYEILWQQLPPAKDSKKKIGSNNCITIVIIFCSPAPSLRGIVSCVALLNN